MTDNSDFLARYMQQDSDDQPPSAPSPGEGLTDEVKLPQPGIADPEAPSVPVLRAPEGTHDPDWANKTTTFERVRGMLPASAVDDEEQTVQHRPQDSVAARDPLPGGPPPDGLSPDSGRGRLVPPPPQPARHGGPPTGGFPSSPPTTSGEWPSSGWPGRPPGTDVGAARVQPPPPPLPPRRHFEQRGPMPERAWSPPPTPPAERWAPRADTQVGQPTPTRSVKPEEVSKRRREPAELGWRKAVYKATGGLVNLGAGKHEQTLRDWSALIKSNIPGNYQIAAISVKGGVGKTRVTSGVGSVFAVERAQPVLAIDGNPTYGGLGRYIDATAWTSIRDFLGAKDQVVDYPTARRFTGRNKQGLEVLAGNQNTASPMPLDAQTFYDTVKLTRRFYQLCLVDCGTEVETDFFKAILSVSDALMIVGSCGVDGGLAIEQTVNWLAARGGHELLKRSVIVLNDANDSWDKHFEAHIRETVGNRVRAVHTIPWDPHLRDGADLDYGALRKRTRLALMELAADLAKDFPTAGALAQ